MKKIITLVCLMLSISSAHSFAQAWASMGGGLGATTEQVKAVAVDPSGNIYVGGTFTGAISYLAKWNGTSWTAVGTGVNGPVYSIGIKTASDIYIGGEFTTAGGVPASNIARWNGSSFTAVGSGFNGKVLCVYVPGSGNVYAGGEFSMSGGTAMIHIAKLIGVNWTPLGGGVPANVNAICEHGNPAVLYAGCDQSANPVLKWDGSNWINVSGISGGKVLALASFANYLYAGGDFSTPIRAAAKWDGANWNTIVTNFNFGQKVNVLYTRLDALYIGGNFTGIGLNTPNYIARITASNAPIRSFTISSELTNGEVLAIGKSAGYVVAGGQFQTPTAPVTNNVAITNQTIDVNELSGLVLEKNLYPNPARQLASLKISSATEIQNPDLKIYDVQSKQVQAGITYTTKANELNYQIDLSGVAPGHYYYVLLSEGRQVTSDIFVVE